MKKFINMYLSFIIRNVLLLFDAIEVAFLHFYLKLYIIAKQSKQAVW